MPSFPRTSRVVSTRSIVSLAVVLAAATCAHAPRPVAADGGAGNQAASSEEPRVCTLIGCDNDLKITIRRDHGSMDAVGVVVTFDGRTITCPPPVRAHKSSCAPGGSVDLDDATEVLSVPVSPLTIDVTLVRDGRKIDSRTIRPRYRAINVNGVGCPGCKCADEIWVLPR